MKNKKIRVLFVPHWYPTKQNKISGIFIERQVESISKDCDAAVLHVEMNRKSYTSISENKGFLEVIVYKKKRRPLSLTSFIGYLEGYRIIKKYFGNFDLFHIQVLYPGSGIFVLLMSLLSKKPYIVSEHSSMYLEEDGTFKEYSSIKKSLIRIVANNAKAIIVVSNCLKEALEKNKIKNKFYIIPNIVDFNNEEREQKGNRIKKMLHISLLKDKEKNVSGILDALKEIYMARQDFILGIVGDGPDRMYLEKIAKDYGFLDDVVFFHGAVEPSKVSNFISNCDFLITNSRYETFSVSTAEALAHGKPVISTRCGGPEEFIDESNGILINVNDKEALVSAIEYMLDNHNRYNSNLIKKIAIEKFSPEIIGKELFEVYKEVLN